MLRQVVPLSQPRCVGLQGKAKGKALSTAFVTFKDTFTTTTASTSMMHHDQRYWNTRAAPAPKVSPIGSALHPWNSVSSCTDPNIKIVLLMVGTQVQQLAYVKCPL